MLIVGGGLSGLSLATKLHSKGIDFHLVESRERFGGRIFAPELSLGAESARFDLGPAWFWPGQARMAGLTRRLGLSVFRQWDEGELVFEDERGRLQRGNFSPMAGSLRVEGGMAKLVDGLVAELPKERLHRSRRVSAIHGPSPEVLIGEETLSCKSLVLALPPRLAAGIPFQPPLDEGVLRELNAVPTWMAGHAKVLALFEEPFWRDDGLSGDGMSRRGPLVEIHDASPKEGGPFALFGFLGTSPARRKNKETLISEVRAQLLRLFGPKAESAVFCLQDWAFEESTATALDHQALHGHPDYRALPSLWEDRVLFASSECSTEFGGYLEGALAAAHSAESVLAALSD